jgi:hypothetical protein
VRVLLEGESYDDEIVIDREYLRTGDNVWVLSEENTLEIRPVEIAARTREQIFIRSGLEEGERLIISNLATAVAGTRLSLGQATESADSMASAPPPTKQQ